MPELGPGNVWLFVVTVGPAMASKYPSTHETVVSNQTPNK